MALDAKSYDQQWKMLQDFIEYNPGARHRRRLINSAIREHGLASSSVIDVGCGLGFTVQAVAELLPLADITGLDLSPVAIAGATERFPNHSWRVFDIVNTSMAETAEIVIFTEVVEHLDDWRTGITRAADFVAVGGLLVLTTQAGRIHNTEKEVGHIRHFTAEELSEILSGLGFEVVRSQTWGWPGYVFLKYLANINSRRTLDAFGSGKYGMIARWLNNLAYLFTYLGSVPNHRQGTQILIVARKSGQV